MGGDSDNHEGNVTVTDSLFIVRGEDPHWSVGDTLDHDTGIPSGRFHRPGISRLRSGDYWKCWPGQEARLDRFSQTQAAC